MEINSEKFEKFNECLQVMLEALNKDARFFVHQHINESYYIQRREEFKLLLEQLDEAKARVERLQHHAHELYQATYCMWRKDVRWLRRHQQKKAIL